VCNLYGTTDADHLRSQLFLDLTDPSKGVAGAHFGDQTPLPDNDHAEEHALALSPRGLNGECWGLRNE